MIHKFKYYLHDGYERIEFADFVMKQIPELTMSKDEFIELIDQPFYEVTLHCQLDDVTGRVSIIAAET